MAALENARRTSPLCHDGASSDGGAGGNALRLRRRAKRRPRGRVGPCGAILLMSALVQRSMAAGGFFNKGSRGDSTPPRPPASSNHNHRDENGNGHPAPPGGGEGGRGAALSPAMYTRISMGPAGTGGEGGQDRAGARQADVGLKARLPAGVAVGSANQQQQRPGVRSGHAGGAIPAGSGSGSGGGEGEGEGEQTRHPSTDPRNSHIAESLLEQRSRGSSSSSSSSSSSGNRAPSGTTRRDASAAASAWRGAGGVGQGHYTVPPEAARREAFLAAGRTPSGRRAALEPRAGAGGQGDGGGPAFDQYRQRRQQGQGFSGQDPWDGDSSQNNNGFDHGIEPRHQQQQQEAVGGGGAGMAVPEGVPGPTPPPRTPLQEQAFQNKYHHQHTQIPGQAVGTQPASSSLFRRAGSGGVFFIFVILVCRALNHYEYTKESGALSPLSRVPAVGLFVGNLVCMCLSLVQSATNRQKARMKSMLTINAVSEAVLLLYNMWHLLGSGSGVEVREDFISRMLANVLFMSLCFTFAKARWVADGAF